MEHIREFLYHDVPLILIVLDPTGLILYAAEILRFFHHVLFALDLHGLSRRLRRRVIIEDSIYHRENARDGYCTRTIRFCRREIRLFWKLLKMFVAVVLFFNYYTAMIIWRIYHNEDIQLDQGLEGIQRILHAEDHFNVDIGAGDGPHNVEDNDDNQGDHDQRDGHHPLD